MSTELEYLKKLRSKINKAVRKTSFVTPEEFMPIYESIDDRIKSLKFNSDSSKAVIDLVGTWPIWFDIDNEVACKGLIKAAKKLKPFKTSNSLHAFEEQYQIGFNTYRFLYAIGDTKNPTISMLVTK